MDTKITLDELENLTEHADKGGYLGLGITIINQDGKPQTKILPGYFIYASNYYGDALLKVNDDYTITPIEVDHES